MSRNASGTYSLPAGNPVVTLEVISSTWANTTLSDLASAMTDSLSRTGLGGMSSPLKLADGAIGAPGLTFGTQTTAGLYRAGASDFRWAIGGSDILALTATTFTFLGNNLLTDGAQTITGAWIFTALGTAITAPAILISNARPGLSLNETGVAANNGKWGFEAQAEQLLFFAATDAGVATNFLTVDRTGGTVDSLTFAATTLAFGASTLSGSGTASWSNSHTFTKQGGTPSGSPIYLNSAAPSIGVRESGASANNRSWDFLVFGEQLTGRVVNDAEDTASTWIAVDRTTTTVDRVAFPSEGANNAFVVGTVGSPPASLAQIRSTGGGGRGGLAVVTASTSGIVPLTLLNEATSGDNVWIVLNEGSGAGTTRGSVDFDRAGVVARFNTTCDGELKDEIMFSKTALPLLRMIPVRSFRWIREKVSVDFGFIAQEMVDLIPSAVSRGTSDRPWGMDFSKLVPLHTKAIQELDARLTAAGL